MIKILSATFLLVFCAIAQSGPPSQFRTKTTHVMALLKVNTPVDREKIMKVMPDEVRDTLKLYLDGKITQWYGRSDGTGVVFILDCNSVGEAKAVLERLPLIQQNLATFEYVELSPLTPLRMLLPATKP